MSEKNTSFVRARIIAFGYMALILTATSTLCTQFVASRLAYHPALGRPLFGNFYNPLDWWGWFFQFHDYAPALQQAFVMFGIGVIVATTVFRLTAGFKSRSSRKHEGIHGTAHFATPEEVRQSGLLPVPGGSGAGVYCGGYDMEGRTQYLRHSGPEHVCVIAPTRSGKGVGPISMTLLSWPESVFVLDPKGENYAITSGWRQRHADNIILRFDPAEKTGSCAWNPLEEIRFGTRYQIGDAQNIALMVIDTDGKGLFDHWRRAAHHLLVGVFIHALYKSETVGRMPSLRECAFMLCGEGDFYPEAPENDFDDGEEGPLAALFNEMRNVTLGDGDVARRTQRSIRAAGNRFANMASKELQSVISTAYNPLSLYDDDIVGENTSRSDFKVSDLMNHDKPVSLYLTSNFQDSGRLKPLVRLLISRILLGLTGKMEFENGRAKPTYKHRLLLMLDEFPTLGKMEVLQSSLAYIAGYGMKAILIIQDVQQLYEAYGNYESIISNCHIRIAYAPTKVETAEWLSKMTGQTTVIKEQISTSGKRFGAGALTQASRSYQEIQRPLMTHDEIMRLPAAEKDREGNILTPGEMLVFVAGNPVIRGRQILYFLDSTFSKRAAITPPASSDAVRGRGD